MTKDIKWILQSILRDPLAPTMGAFIVAMAIILGCVVAYARPVGGDDLCAVQAKLIEQGFYEGEVDCQAGPKLARAVRAFQRAKELYEDGVVGEDTFKAIMGRFPGEGGEQQQAGEDERPTFEGGGGDYSFEGRKCKDKTIHARGSARPWTSWARATARKNWNEAARFEYGELFADWENAQKVGGGKDGLGIICTRASVGGVDTYRCQFSGKACQAGS